MFGLGKNSISDMPVKGDGKATSTDTLRNTPYADALAKFMVNSDTPITIGIQGGWGSGKTSLMNMLEEKISDSSLVVKVNAWEYSLFGNKEDVAMSLLSGLISELRCAVDDAYNANPKRIGEETRTSALNLQTRTQQALQLGFGLIKGIAGASIRVATNNAVNNIIGNDEDSRFDFKPGESAQPKIEVSSVKELRKLLAKVIATIMEDNIRSIHRIVFLVDDLDRVEPSLAVQILDVLKNVMELRHCVFVLAIDFDVVVQGLKSKYGDKSNQTEREHRQYFDKIIQVPFSMPVNSYRDKIKSLIVELIHSVGISCDETQADTLSGHAWRLTDGTPRSIKRVINTLSLLSLLSDIERSEASKEAISADELEILFVFVCLQINFPAVFNQIARLPTISDWSIDDALQEGVLDDDLDYEGVDDGWESVLYGICSKDAWSKKKNADIVKSLTSTYEGPINNIGGTSKLSEILSKVSVTSVNPGRFIEAKNGVYDYFQLGGMTAEQVLGRSKSGASYESGDGVYQLQVFTGIGPIKIKRNLNDSQGKLVQDIFPEYLRFKDSDVLKEQTVSFVREWNLYNVISKCLEMPLDEVKVKLQSLRGNTTLKTALKDCW